MNLYLPWMVGILSVEAFFGAHDALAGADPAGRLVTGSGTVSAVDGQGKARTLKPGDEIRAGDSVLTKDGSSAKLFMTDRSILDLGSNSNFKIDTYKLKSGGDREVAFSMSSGTLRASVNQPVTTGKFKISTKTATMGVRGTEFVVNGVGGDKNAQTQITVLHGRVEVANPLTPNAAPIALTDGKQLTSVMSGGKIQAPQVMQLNATQVRAVAQEAKVKDNTFHQSVSLEQSSSSGGGGGAAASAPSSGGGGGGTMSCVTDAMASSDGGLGGDSSGSGGAPSDYGATDVNTVRGEDDSDNYVPANTFYGMPAHITVVFHKGASR